MKKLLTIVIALLLFIPTIVLADIQVLHLYYNRNVAVCGELQINMPVAYDTEYNLTVTYDSSMLSIKEDMIELSDKSSDKNYKEVKIEDGKITIKAKMYNPSGVINEYPDPRIVLRFTALKEGKTTVKMTATNYTVVADQAEVTITKLKDSCMTKTEETTTTETNTTETNTEANTNNTTTNTTTDTSKTKCKTNMLPFYISLIINGILLILLVILALKKSKKKQEVSMYNYN